MPTDLNDVYIYASKWSNENQGVVSVVIFVVTIVLGWVTGIFSALRRRPKFKITVIDGPTFCCTYSTGTTHGEYEVHRTGIALYLVVTNVGSAASSIQNISIGYHWNLRPFNLKWLRYTVGWYWLKTPTASLTDFQAMIGENIKVYPFLIQRNYMSPAKANTYLEVGRSANGVVYFEQSDSWGGRYPIVRHGQVHIKVRITDVFGIGHTAKFKVPSVSMESARKYNPAFGKTLAELRGERLPIDERN